MRIDKVQNTYTQPNFKAGKVRVFSDFDKTFLPSSHNNFARNYDIKFVNNIRENFKNFKEFLNNTKDGLKFTITTGRTFGEFMTMAEISRERKFGMPLPDTLIVKNGSDEHIRVNTDEDFYNGGEFPFKYEVTNKEKEAKIKEISGWDGEKVKKIIYDVLKSYNFRIVEADSENSVKDYGARSMFSEGKIPYEVGRVFYGTDKADWSVGIRRDGNLKMFLTFPPDMYTIEERNNAFNDMQKKINEDLKKEGIKIAPDIEKHFRVNDRPCISYMPMISTSKNQQLTKLYDTKEAFQEAKKNNDLVIVAGDGSNDFEMLNPGYYLKDYFTEDMYKRHGKRKLEYAAEYPEDLVKLLEKDSEIADIYMKMPFRGIVVRQHDGENKLHELEPLSKGKYQKIIIVDEGELQSGIKQSIKSYCEQNPKYNEKLNSDLKKQIGSETSKDPKNTQTDNGDNDDEGVP